MTRHRRAVALLLSATFLLVPCGPVGASEDDDLLEALGDVALYVDTEVLVAGATRRVAKLSEAPGTITVIDRAQLEAWGVLTLEEALRTVTSLLLTPGSISTTAQVRDIEQLFGNKILLLQDGRLLNSVFRGNAFVGLAQPIENVERIEVVRGPGSALYGANAFAGFINIITRRGDQLGGVDVQATGGSNGLGRVAVVAGDRRGESNWTAEARVLKTAGEDPVNRGEPNSDHEDGHVAFHWGKGTSKGEKWFANFSYTDVDAGVPGTFAFKTPGDCLREERISADFFRLWEPSAKTKLKLRTYWNRLDGQLTFRRSAVDLLALSDRFLAAASGPRAVYDLDLARASVTPNPMQEPDDPDACVPCDHVAVAPPGGGTAAEFAALAAGGLPQVIDVDAYQENLGFAELQADWEISRTNYLLGGVSFRIDDLDDATIGSRRFENAALFVEDEQRFLDDELILLGSLRLDDHSLFGVSLSPRVSLIWSPRKELIMKAAYGKAFRSPNFVELHGDTRVGAARIFGQREAVEQGILLDVFERVDVGCNPVLDDCPTLSTELKQEEIETIELWTEYTPVERLKVILNLYWFEIVNEVGVALDRNDIYFFAAGSQASAIRPSGVDYDGDTVPDFTPPTRSLFAIPGLEDVPTLGVFLNAPDPTTGYGAELEVRARPWDWLTTSWSYSRRENERGEVRAFVEADDAAADQRLVPTFGTSGFRADSSVGVVTLRRRDDLWGSLRLRWLGRPDRSFLSGGGAFTTDVSAGWSRENFSVVGTVLNVNGGGTFFDPIAGDFVETERDVRLTLSYWQDF